jgi:threonine dehydratase
VSVLSLVDVYRARRRLEGRVVRTPLVESSTLTRFAGAPVFLKLETVQPTGSFKIRGATKALGRRLLGVPGMPANRVARTGSIPYASTPMAKAASLMN